MNVVEPLADIATGAAAARAVEPQTGIDATGHTTERNCLNCTTPLVGDYCHACGQHGHVHRSLGAFGHDLLHGVFHFEGKIWRTLPLLAWRPGLLTRRYIEGQRASFVGPLPFFLFSVFLMFAVAGLTGGISLPSDQAVQTGLSQEVKEAEGKLADMRAQLAKAGQDPARAKELREQIVSAESELAVIRPMQTDGIAKGAATRMSDDVPTALRGPIANATENPKLLFYKLKNNAYKYSWALIPLSVPLLWMLFPFSRRFRLYDHTVFVTYSLCFMSILVIVGMLWRAAGLTGSGLLLLLPPVHMYRQLRGAYSLGRAGALWRAIVLATGATIILSVFALSLLAIGALE